MKRPKSHLILSLMAMLAASATSCSRSTKFSSVLDGGFDPVAAFRQHGCAVQNETRGEGIRNAEYGYAWQSWCGVLAGSPEQVRREAIAVVIRDELNKTLNHTALDELTVRAGDPEGQPLTGMLRYNKDSVHGDMHVWLTPVASNGVMSYVIFVREERMK